MQKYRTPIALSLLMLSLIAAQILDQPMASSKGVEVIVPPIWGQSEPSLPDFAAISDVKQKKQAFFDFLLPFVVEENKRMAALRQRLVDLQEEDTLGDAERVFIEELKLSYRLPKGLAADAQITELLLRVDVLPPSLVLAQAANESAWGTSRFALEANNLFGQWCFSEGCGVVPKGRPAGERYEVRRFDDVGASVGGYFFNLNSQPSYHQLRELRRSYASLQPDLSLGEWLATGLTAYSSRGSDYVEEIQAMIRVNKLAALEG